MEQRICRVSGQPFQITPQEADLHALLQKPLPHTSPLERWKLQFGFLNALNLFPSKCALTGVPTMSMFAPDSGITAYASEAWWSDQWDALSYGRDYDPTRPFFEQVRELMYAVPLPATFGFENTNCPYNNFCFYSKDCYMCFMSQKMERCFYTYNVSNSKDSADASYLFDSELCYDCIDCTGGYRLLYSQDCTSCAESYFLLNCRNCKNCFGCYGLSGKEYCYFNEQLTPEAYKTALAKHNLLSRSAINALRAEVDTFFLRFPRKFAHQTSCENSTGDYLNHTENTHVSFDVTNATNVLYNIFALGDEGPQADCTTICSSASCRQCSYSTGLGYCYDMHYCICCEFTNSAQYSWYCYHSNDLFGCAGLDRKKYCILNKQYTKEEYEVLKARIIADMKARGEYGEFFPAEMSPFAYNHSDAQFNFPQKEAPKGMRWGEPVNVVTQAPGGPAPDVATFDDAFLRDIPQQVYASTKSGRAYKVSQQELALYAKLGVPLPDMAYMERLEARQARRNPYELWQRHCMNNSKNCEHQFLSSYSPERREIVYCEACYNETIA